MELFDYNLLKLGHVLIVIFSLMIAYLFYIAKDGKLRTIMILFFLAIPVSYIMTGFFYESLQALNIGFIVNLPLLIMMVILLIYMKKLNDKSKG